MDKRLEKMINDTINNKNKQIFKIYKQNDTIAVLIRNMDNNEIFNFSINAISKILDLFPEEDREDIVSLAKSICKTKDGNLFN